ncbi:uncharacterized protein TNCT_117071 [Trichonephila clavata]|uniref:Tetratricopeptide repeat protein n=1 Tax=Trichonephila clavata TaxID=2740835 RepID=A0A8X6GK58_TRICU|nr:uncharacterized protein TNCT_117071 [Trichonephila clavata]
MLKLNESKNINSSVEKFFQEYDALKESEDWKGIIDIGLKALEDSKITNENLALIKCRLTSCYYYLGQFEEALKVAKGTLEGATQADKKELQARSLYLISAIYRALFLKASEEEKTEQKYKESASENIERALKLLSDHDVSDFTKAKVYFNAGALEHDVNVSLGSALEHYSQAMKLFKLWIPMMIIIALQFDILELLWKMEENN